MNFVATLYIDPAVTSALPSDVWRHLRNLKLNVHFEIPEVPLCHYAAAPRCNLHRTVNKLPSYILAISGCPVRKVRAAEQHNRIARLNSFNLDLRRMSIIIPNLLSSLNIDFSFVHIHTVAKDMVLAGLQFKVIQLYRRPVEEHFLLESRPDSHWLRMPEVLRMAKVCYTLPFPIGNTSSITPTRPRRVTILAGLAFAGQICSLLAFPFGGTPETESTVAILL